MARPVVAALRRYDGRSHTAGNRSEPLSTSDLCRALEVISLSTVGLLPAKLRQEAEVAFVTARHQVRLACFVAPGEQRGRAER